MDNTPRQKLVTLDARPEPIEIDLTRTALIVVDMQNGFVSPGGMFDQAGYDISGAAAAVAQTARLLPPLRDAGAKIVFLKMSYSEDYSDAGGPLSPNPRKELGLLLMKERPETWGKYVTQNSWDEEICKELTPSAGDILVRKQRYSGFAGTNLDMILKTHGIRYCLYAGVATNVCVETTLRDGYLLDYWPILVADGCNNSGPEYNQQASIWNVEHAFGWVTNTDDVLRALR